MAEHEAIKLFEENKMRVFFDDVAEEWYFCILDVVQVLTESVDPAQYIKRMRQRDAELNSVWGTICKHFMCAFCGKSFLQHRPISTGTTRRSLVG